MNRPQLFARLILAGIGLLVLTLAVTFAGCASHRPPPDERTTAQQVDSSARKVESLPPKVDSPPDSAAVNATQPTPAPALSGPSMSLFQRINPFQHRETQKTGGPTTYANATQVPRKCKGCSFYYAPATIIGKKATASVGANARTTVAGKKATQATDSATVTAIGKAKAPVAVGAGATATQTNPTTGISWWLLLIPAGYVAWRVYRSTIPFA